MPVYLYCAAYTRKTMHESSPPCEQRRITFNGDGQRVQLARPELPEPHYICMYRLLPTTPPPPSPSKHYYSRLIAGTNLPTRLELCPVCVLLKKRQSGGDYSLCALLVKFNPKSSQRKQIIGSDSVYDIPNISESEENLHFKNAIIAICKKIAHRHTVP